jgi:hypothetical protein
LRIMKSHILAALAVAFILVQSCKEIGPKIDFTGVVASDTTYEIPATGIVPEARRILAEEATGVKCPNCPAGAEALEAEETAHPGRIIVVSLHANFLADPLPESKYDFRTTYSMDIMNLLGGEPAKPAAAFDRTIQNGNIFTDRIVWPTVISQRLGVPPPVNLQLTSSYDEVKREAVIRVKATYNAQVSKQQNLTVLITEDNIVDPQDDNRKVPPVVEDYEHRHVLRTILTPVGGSGMIDSIAVKKPGRVYERTFIYKLPDAAFTTPAGATHNTIWNISNLKVVAFINNNETNDKEVAQAVETHLKP